MKTISKLFDKAKLVSKNNTFSASYTMYLAFIYLSGNMNTKEEEITEEYLMSKHFDMFIATNLFTNNNIIMDSI